MIPRSTIATLVALTAVSVVAGCGGDDPSSGDDVQGVTWTLVEMGGEALPDEAVVTLEYDGESVAGTSACNQYGGSAEFADGEVSFPSPLATTRMACVDPLMQVEADYLATLLEAAGFDVADDTLTLSDADGTVVLVFRGT